MIKYFTFSCVIAILILFGCYQKESNIVFYPQETHGYDLSHHNQNVSWDKLNGQFVYLKATEGTWYKDPKFKEYKRKARQHNLKVGAYHFMRPNKTGKQQFNYFRKVVGKNIDLIPVLDIEVGGLSNKNIQEFITECEKYYGVKPMIYANRMYHLKHKSAVKGCKWWMAYYLPCLESDYALWQYSDKKKIAGTTIDHNYINPKYTITDFIL